LHIGFLTLQLVDVCSSPLFIEPLSCVFHSEPETNMNIQQQNSSCASVVFCVL
jgi:hypothetical protein